MPSIGIYNWSTATWNDSLDANAPIWRDTNGVQGGQTPPPSGASILVPNGTTLILDEPAPPQLAVIRVEGILSFADIDIDLDVDCIDVAASGALEVGTETTPITAQINIRLTDNYSVSEPRPGEPMSIRVFGGRIDMHGTPPVPTWTRIAQTVTTSDTELTLQDEVDWPNGATIVIASTDFDPNQTEERVIDNNTTPGSGVGTLSFRVDTLDHMHYGGSEGPYNRLSVDMYAEVAVLERNIKVFADMAPLGVRAGQIQIRIMSDTGAADGNPPVARLDGIEVTGLGQHNIVENYPIHFHHAGDVGSTGSYLKNSSIHHNNFRTLTIHDTQNLDVSHNLAYETWGHAFYLEDGNETGNTFAWNVALNMRAIQGGVVPSDAEPAGFYVTHPLNVFHHNVAAASEGHGFYYERLPPWDGSPLPGNDEFLDNVAHSNRMKGYFLDYQYRPTTCITLGYFTAYKNGEYGLWLRTRSAQKLFGLCMADNRSGLYLASGGWQDPDDSRITVRRSLIVGESANVGEYDGMDDFEVALGRSLPEPHPQLAWPATLVGVDIYDGHLHIHGTTFANFTNYTIDTTTRQAAAFSQVQKFSPWAVDPRNRVSALSFINANRVWFRDGNNEMGAINAMLVDEDGTLTGLPGGVVIANEAFLYPAGALPANTVLDPVTGADWNTQVVDGNSVLYGQFQLINLDHDACPDPRPVDEFELHATSGGTTTTMLVLPAIKDRNRFGTNLLIGMDPMAGSPLYYDLQYPNLPLSTDWPTRLRLKLRSGPAGQGIILSLPLAAVPMAGDILIDGADVPAPSLAALVPGSWMYDTATQKLWLSLAINAGSEPAPLDNRETLVEIG